MSRRPVTPTPTVSERFGKCRTLERAARSTRAREKALSTSARQSRHRKSGSAANASREKTFFGRMGDPAAHGDAALARGLRSAHLGPDKIELDGRRSHDPTENGAL